MGKKITILCGSPRKNGNTNRMVKYVKEGAAENGAEIEIIDIARLNYKVNGCIACMGCQSSEKFECVIKDDASPILKRLPESDVIALATPVYWFGPTAQLKLFLDRTFSLIKIDPETQEPIHNLNCKTFAVIVTGGGDLNGGINLVDQTYKTAVDYLGGMEYKSLLVPFAPMNPEDIEKNTELCNKAREFGKALAG